MPNTRNVSAMTTWHSQAAFLWVAGTWGLSYVIPPHYRVPFAEVFPTPAPLPMWVWGLFLLAGAATSLIAERLLRKTHYSPWNWALGGHMVLAGTYLTLAACALVEGLMEVPTTPHMFYGVLPALSTLSRPVLWGVVGWLHITFARLPRIPELPEPVDE